jgi:uncharacterized repeat protein (TIGR02543 family)
MFTCASALVASRFVTVTASTRVAAYTAAGLLANGITLEDSDNGVVSVQLLSDMHQDFVFQAETAIVLGDSIEVGTDGMGIPYEGGFVVCTARDSIAASGLGTGFNLIKPSTTYAVTFVANGGSATAPQAVGYRQLVVEPADPTRALYTFSGWFHEVALTTEWAFDVDVVTAATSMYARWTLT